MQSTSRGCIAAGGGATKPTRSRNVLKGWYSLSFSAQYTFRRWAPAAAINVTGPVRNLAIAERPILTGPSPTRFDPHVFFRTTSSHGFVSDLMEEFFFTRSAPAEPR